MHCIKAFVRLLGMLMAEFVETKQTHEQKPSFPKHILLAVHTVVALSVKLIALNQ